MLLGHNLQFCFQGIFCVNSVNLFRGLNASEYQVMKTIALILRSVHIYTYIYIHKYIYIYVSCSVFRSS